MNSQLTHPVIVHSFPPMPPGIHGGINWAWEGTPAEFDVRGEFAINTDTAGHDYLPTHKHRLVQLDMPVDLFPAEVSAQIAGLLDLIDGGHYDDTPADLGKLIPTTEQEALSA